MGLVKRIRRLTVASIENFLNTIEDPEILFPQLVREMEDQARAAVSAEAKAMAASKAAERNAGAVRRRLDRMIRGAEIAVDKGDSETAREAVRAQIALESELKIQTDAVSRALRAHDDAKAVRGQIEQQLDELRAKKNEILTRARVAASQRRIAKAVRDPVNSTASILDAVIRLEGKIEAAEAELEIGRGTGKGSAASSIEGRLGELEQDSEVERRLAEMKRRLSGSRP
jgi:phage shock protein A